MAGEFPAGTIIMFGGAKDNLPSGWYHCDGRKLPQDSFRDLFNAIGHSFGDVSESPDYDPNKEFFLPDLRGRFVRGVDDGSGNDPDAATRTDMKDGKRVDSGVGSLQPDDFRSHQHEYSHIKDETPGKGIVSGNYWSPGGDKTKPAGGKETRPVNAALYYLIRT
jgi:hypothetical protein